ncbi:MAG TPA: hypothetical protein VJ783_25085 [Pirellulales bacterium]|nr:hypothetical protein [Pirellulales bacterium]
MRTAIGMAILAVSGAVGIFGATNRNEPPVPQGRPAAGRDRLIVHEWGTFTNFSGSDGIQLEFRPLIDQELPPFVYERSWSYGGFLDKGRLVARQRMETPVTYFYSDLPRELDVRVDFPQGFLTEFYPPATDISKPTSLSWRVALQPTADHAAVQGRAATSPALPEVAGDDHYGFARETDSAIVRTVDRHGKPHHEKFLFYRGVGNFSLPLRLEPLPGRRFRVVNDGPDPIEPLFLVMIDDEGLHFCQHARLSPHAALEAVVPESTAAGDELGDRMIEALVAAGLYEKEARAMIHTWQSSWFSEPGARLFYFVPRRLTDQIIPLHIEPSPDETVRVLVGRMEALTPEAASRLLSIIQGLGTCMSADAEPLHRELERLGRFAEPALNYLMTLESDPTTRAQIERLRTELRR